MREIARVAGVSRTAVYHVVNNRAGEVGQETRARILRTIRELGYVPTPRLKAKHQRKVESVGCVISATAHTLTLPGYYRQMLDSIMLAFEPYNINLTLFTGSLFSVDASDQVRLYCDGRCDGMLLTALRADSVLPSVLAERGTPFVMIGSKSNLVDGYTVDFNSGHGISTILKYLTDMGHRRIAFCPGPDYVPSALARRDAFHECTGALGIRAPIVPGLDRSCEPGELEQWVRHILSLAESERPTAIIAWTDEAALMVIEQARIMGIAVPSSLSVTGFDDIMDLSSTDPPLTSYRQPCQEIAATAVSHLRSQFKTDFQSGNILVNGELIVRESVVVPRS